MPPLLTISYWFNIRAIPFHPMVMRIMLVLFVVLIVIGIGFSLLQLKKAYAKEVRRAYKRLGSHLTWTGLIGLMLWTFLWQGIPILSMKFFYIPWAIWFVWGFVTLYKYLFKEIPEIQKTRKEREEAEKWLPKPKK